ncbi:MAG: hypothetical protein WAM82_09460 [Thermoanaerobaculia bacterium]
MRSTPARRLLMALSLLAVAAPAAAQPIQKVQLLAADAVPALTWRSVASDPPGDVLHPHLPDARDFAYAFDPKTDLLWFKVSTFEALPERWFGINVALDVDGNLENGMTWWGTNKFKFDRLASAYLFMAEGYWQGLAGVADSEAAGRGFLSNLSKDVKVALDREKRAIFLGIPRSTLGGATTVRAIATVGSMLVNNDDVPNQGYATIQLTSP